MKLQNQKRFRRQNKPVVCMLAAAQEPVTVEQVAEWTGLGTFEIKQVIADWRQFLNISTITSDEEEADEPRWQLYHASFQDFLREDVGLKEEHQAIERSAVSKIPKFFADSH